MTYEEARKKILEYLCVHRDAAVSSADLHSHFGISPEMLNETINRMILDGYLKRVQGTHRVRLDSAGIAWCERLGTRTPSN